jgi:hypothetical protein
VTPLRAAVLGLLGLQAVVGASAEPGAAGEADRVQADVRAAVAALYAGDVEVILKYTHPVIVQALGGAPAAREAIAGVAARTDDTVLESIDFPLAPDFVQGQARRYAVVPVHVVLWQNSRRTHNMSFQFGVLDPSSGAWTYLEGSRLDSQALAQLFPDFPAGYEFPPVSREEQE